MYIHQDDAKEYYDRIIRNHANFNKKKFLISNNVYKIYCDTHEKIEFKTQLHHVISKIPHSSSKEFPFHGAGQGVSNAGTELTFISVPMINVAEVLTGRCINNLPQGTEK